MIQRMFPDGGWIASGTEEGVVRVQSVITGDERWSVPEAHRGAIRVIAWAPDGSAVASGGDDAVVNVWDAATGAVLTRYTEHTGSITALDWSPNGSWITSAEGTGGPHIWPTHKNNTTGLQN